MAPQEHVTSDFRVSAFPLVIVTYIVGIILVLQNITGTSPTNEAFTLTGIAFMMAGGLIEMVWCGSYIHRWLKPHTSESTNRYDLNPYIEAHQYR
jgi:hypothetical protein